ncbi:MAG: ABC transporter ATP-binding protein, partial [Akkermansiaceae bacterium]|nr:ABC transporter ATP-binding protein [Verrucomicrobiales bacterium]
MNSAWACVSMLGALPADVLWRLERVSLSPSRLQEVSLTIPRGVTAVLGWSGAGKTSLLNLLAQFEQPDAGRIIGTPTIAWVPHSGGLWPHCTVREHLRIACPSGTGIEATLAAFDLAEKAQARPHELSQGEQARLAVARALVAGAEVLIMDEPLAHVDPARIGDYWRAIREALAISGATLVFSTHDPDIAVGEAAEAICLAAGRVIHAG